MKKSGKKENNATWLTQAEMCKVLNYTPKEIDDLVLQRRIPHHIVTDPKTKKKKRIFPKEEVLLHLDARPGEGPQK